MSVDSVFVRIGIICLKLLSVEYKTKKLNKKDNIFSIRKYTIEEICQKHCGLKFVLDWK